MPQPTIAGGRFTGLAATPSRRWRTSAPPCGWRLTSREPTCTEPGRSLLAGRADEAIADCDYALQQDPHLSSAHLARGCAWAKKGDWAAALADLSETLRLDPNNARAYYLRGSAHAKQGDSSRALADLTEALRLEPDHARAWAHRSAAFRLAGHHDRALSDMAHAVRLDPGFAVAYCNQRGAVHYGRRHFEQAVADFTIALLLDPDNLAVHEARDHALRKLRLRPPLADLATQSCPARLVEQPRTTRPPVPHQTPLPSQAISVWVKPAAADPSEAVFGVKALHPAVPAALAPAFVSPPTKADIPALSKTAHERALGTAVSTPPAELDQETSEPASEDDTDFELSPEVSQNATGSLGSDEEEYRREQELVRQKEAAENAQSMAQLTAKAKAQEEKQTEKLARWVERWAGKRRRSSQYDEKISTPVWKKLSYAVAALIGLCYVASLAHAWYKDYQLRALLTPGKICQDFSQNGEEARKKYEGNTFVLTGKVKKVYTPKGPGVIFDVPNMEDWSIQCIFESPDALNAIQQHEVVTVQGVCHIYAQDGKNVVLLEDCILCKAP